MRLPQLALAVVIVTTLLSPWRRELFAGDETKYSQVVREMRAGAFFLPTLEGSPFTHKPPLHFWIVDLLTLLFGVYSIWPFVLPSLIAFGLLLWLLAKWEGPLAAFVCGTSLMVWGSAQTARMDVEFTLLLAYAAWMLQRAFDGERTLVRAGVATGIAMLVKGPMAPVIILVLFAIEAARRRRIPDDRRFGRALGAMIVIPLAWLTAAVSIGGRAFWNEVFFKQTVGRAVGSWVHQSPPWFYVLRAPMTLLPWFFLLVVAIVAVYKRGDERAKFYVSWIAAVIVPYSLLSSKLDVYMMAMIPAVALVISRLDERRAARIANGAMAAIFLVIGVAGLFVQRPEIPAAARPLFVVLVIAALLALAVTMRGRLVHSTIAVGFIAIAALAYAATALAPLANEMASSAPLVRALEKQNVPPEQMALFVCPHLWARGMSPALERVRYVDKEDLRRMAPPQLIVARRKNSGEIYDILRDYHRVGELQLIGKWFDVYKR
ncbi:MAG TPA: glycosyltransferase family 39 protein [Thermoanaerobaculia bacterium]|nr:glycosyltransferase family 39 protein [Thermoanaerobaculia bacterium]